MTSALPWVLGVAAGLAWASGCGAAGPAAPADGSQAARRTPTIALVVPRPEQGLEAGFRAGLLAQGLAPRFEVVRWSGQAQDQAALVTRLRALAPDLIYTAGSASTLAVVGPFDADAAPYIRDLPVVFTDVADPVAARLVSRLAGPGRNLTGVPGLAPLPAQWAALRAYRPFRRIGVIVNPAEPYTLQARDGLAALAARQGVTLLEAELPLDAQGQPDAAALPQQVRGLAARGAEVLVLGPSTFLAQAQADVVTRTAREAGMATFCVTEFTLRQSGCLFGLVAEAGNAGRFAGRKAWQVLRGGRRVQDVPIEPLQRFSMLINMPVANQLALYPPLALLEAAEVIAPASAPRRSAP